MIPLPREIGQAGVQRYGFHGLSYEYVISVLRRVAPDIADARVVVAHLGSGASLCALKGGKRVGTSLGFTVLDGLCMGTRPGALDPGVILFLFKTLRLSAEAVETILYKKSGLLGISGISNDMRDLLASREPAARLAVDYFVYRATKEIGALAAVLGGSMDSYSPPVSEKTLLKSAAESASLPHGLVLNSTCRPTTARGPGSQCLRAVFRHGWFRPTDDCPAHRLAAGLLTAHA